MATVDEEPRVFNCYVCDAPFQSAREVAEHYATHSKEEQDMARRARRMRSDHETSTPRARRGRPPGRAPTRTPARTPPMSSVRTLLTTGYALVGTGMAVGARARQDDRLSAVAQSVMMTAGPGGDSCDKLAKRVPPLYKMLQAAAGGAGVLEDAAPLAVPLMVGMYVYAPAMMQEMIRPMAATMLGIVLYQVFPYDEPPSMPNEMTPIAIPKWIQEFADGLLPRPQPQVKPEPQQQAPTVEQQPAA